MPFKVELAFASGRSHKDCHCIAYRSEPDTPDVDAGESNVVSLASPDLFLLSCKPGWLTGLWRSDDGRVYLSDIAGGVYVNSEPPPQGKDFVFNPLSGGISGIWGLDDRHVWAWGQRGPDAILYFFDGSEWREVEAPGFVVAMHGPHPELVMAVGRDGLVAQWNGSRWRRLDPPTTHTLSDVFVVSEEEMYACSPKGELLEGSVHGWSTLLSSDKPLHCVAKAFGTVWVGAGSEGLLALSGKELTVAKPKVLAKRFDARHGLLVSAPNAVVYSADGASFSGQPARSIEEMLAANPPSWNVSAKYRDA